ncbi:MAG: hypothetical protein COB04_03695 [Gammaproteobacteria bacterium]|nr:MAG: hypothetical protein COB04_03695 [Gammaproteobacteria bacterium]
MTDLNHYFQNNPGRLIHKWLHYFPIYEHHFARFRNQPITLLEFGVFHGGSLQMWKHYFGPQAKIIGVDINPECKAFEEEQIEIIIGDQENRQFLADLGAAIPPIDILIDDGGHRMNQQITTFEEMYGKITAQGVYLCEDTMTSYWSRHGGGYRNPNSFIEYSKNLIDLLHAWHSKDQESFNCTPFTQMTDSIHFYNSVVAIEKSPQQKPSHQKTGTPSFFNQPPC